MPELVEVETTRRDLSKIIEGKVINKVSVFLDKIVYNDKENFIKKIENNTVHEVKRRGKWLLFLLDNYYLVIHFRMEGRFYLKKLNDKKDKHDYIIFDFDSFSLHYNDPRLFGKMQIVKKEQIDEFFKEKKLGLEYDDINLNSNYLKEKLKKKNTSIKKVLLSQEIITGIGNIYADEILFLSKINPKSKASKLSIRKLNDIILNTKKVFEEALYYKGTYPNIDGKRGEYEKYLKVYSRKNKPCYVCKNIIVREEIQKRGTYYCNKCQKMYK